MALHALNVVPNVFFDILALYSSYGGKNIRVI